MDAVTWIAAISQDPSFAFVALVGLPHTLERKVLDLRLRPRIHRVVAPGPQGLHTEFGVCTLGSWPKDVAVDVSKALRVSSGKILRDLVELDVLRRPCVLTDDDVRALVQVHLRRMLQSLDRNLQLN